jgi:hypothetical protein
VQPIDALLRLQEEVGFWDLVNSASLDLNLFLLEQMKDRVFPPEEHCFRGASRTLLSLQGEGAADAALMIDGETDVAERASEGDDRSVHGGGCRITPGVAR